MTRSATAWNSNCSIRTIAILSGTMVAPTHTAIASAAAPRVSFHRAASALSQLAPKRVPLSRRPGARRSCRPARRSLPPQNSNCSIFFSAIRSGTMVDPMHTAITSAKAPSISGETWSGCWLKAARR